MQILCISVGPVHTAMGAIAYWSALVRSKKPVGRERGCIHTGIWKKSSELVQNMSKIRVVRKSKPEIGPVRKRTVTFPCEQKRQVQFRSTFRTCWVSIGTRKCISLTKLITLSQYIRETFSYRYFFIFRNKLLDFNFSEPQNCFLKFYYRCFFLNFFNHKLSLFRRWSMNVVNCLEIFCMHFCAFGRIKKLQNFYNIISWMSEEIIIFLANVR